MSASSRPTGLRLSHGESMIQLPSLLLNASVLPCGTGNLTISAYLCWHLAARSMTSQHSAQGRSQDFSKGGHHPGIADYIWFIPLHSLVYQRAQSYYRGMKGHIN